MAKFEFVIVFLFISLIGFVLIPSVFADTVHVSIPEGSAIPGCEKTNQCWIPTQLTIEIGDTVRWSNDDTDPHTVTSGTPSSSPENLGSVFDILFLKSGTTFEHTFDLVGTFDYLCLIHPWMTGVVIVQEAMAEEPMEEEPMEEETMETESVMISIEADPVSAGEKMTVNVSITGSDGSAVEHANIDIAATQGNKRVLDELNVHDHDGIMSFDTSALESDASGDNPVDIEVTFQGYGLPSDPKTGPVGEEMTVQVVPEFGTIAMMILAVGVVSIIAFTAKSKVIPRL